MYFAGIGVIRAYDSLKIMCQEVTLQKPEKLTSVNLRKYTATISQARFEFFFCDTAENLFIKMAKTLGFTLK